MSAGSASTVTFGSAATVSVFTKSSGGLTVVSIGGGGVDDVDVTVGATTGGGVFFVRHAGTSAIPIKATPQTNVFSTLFIVFSAPSAGADDNSSAEFHSAFFDQSGSLFSPLNVSCSRSVPSTRIR